MHYTGTIWRPPYEAGSLLLQVTAGCTHHKCKFCTLYADLPFPFRLSPRQELESDLLEVQTADRDPISQLIARLNGIPTPKEIYRVFLTGANSFVLRTEKLLAIADLIRQYLPKVETIGCFARVTDAVQKTDEDLFALRQAGYDGLTIGMETGDDEALRFMHKGYTAADILTQCSRLPSGHRLQLFLSHRHFWRRTGGGGSKGYGGALQPASPTAHRSKHADGLFRVRTFCRDSARELGRGKRSGEVSGAKNARSDFDHPRDLCGDGSFKCGAAARRIALGTGAVVAGH